MPEPNESEFVEYVYAPHIEGYQRLADLSEDDQAIVRKAGSLNFLVPRAVAEEYEAARARWHAASKQMNAVWFSNIRG